MDSATKSWFIGIVVSFVLALIAYLIEHGSHENEARRAGISSALNMALLGVILTALIANNFDSKAQLERAIPRIKSPTLQSVVGDIAELDQMVAGSPGNEKIYEITMDPLRQALSHGISQAKQGVIETGSVAQTINLTSDLMKEARGRVVMTSYILPSEWWATSAGSDYSQKTEDAPKHVESIERIFIIDNDAELKFLRATMQQQQQRGVKVKFVRSSNLDKNLLRDFIIIDDFVVGELVLDDSRKFKGGRFYTSKTMAADYENWFKQIMVWAQDPTAK